MELEIENTEVVSADNIQIEAPGSVEVIEGEKDYKVSVVKKEYTIIGDSIFIPSMYEDAPPWIKEFIDTTIDVAVTNRDQSLIDRMEAILTAMDYVPKNMYTEQINQIVSEDGIINSRIATLNSNLTDAISSTNATVAEINLTYASKDEASAIAINALTASLSADGEIGSALIQLQEAYANLESTTAQSISMLESVMEGEINGNATAMETIRTYVGIDEAGASTSTGLSGYLEASDGTIGGADSQLANDVRVTAEGVESKFAYNSIVNINGIYKKSGFGLTTNYTSGDGSQANPYGSEFWIDATKLMFTNSDKTGRTSPFTIDASGVTPQITFNGKVAFTNVTGYTAPTKLSEFVNDSGYVLPTGVAAAVNSNTTTIDGSKITTGSIAAAQIAAGTITADKISTYNLTASNATIQNGMISNAMITDASITNAKIGDAQITTAKIGDLSVSTLKIQDEAVIVPRSADGSGSVSIVYNTGATSHNLILMVSSIVYTSAATTVTLYVNGTAIEVFSASTGATQKISFNKIVNGLANTNYTITATAYYSGTTGARPISLIMLGAKK